VDVLQSMIGPHDFPWIAKDGNVFIAKFQGKEYDRNYLLFWVDAEKFKRLPPNQPRLAANKLWLEYIHKNVTRAVRCPGFIKQLRLLPHMYIVL